MKTAQFQRFLGLHAKKYGLLAKGKVFKQTQKGASRFYVRSDKLNLIELTAMYHDFKVYASNNFSEATWNELVRALRRITVPSINISGVNRHEHEQEFLIWIDKLASCIIPVNKETPLEKINFSSLEDIRRQVISSSVKKYNLLLNSDKSQTEDFLPRALAAVVLYHISKILHASFLRQTSELSDPVSLDYLATEVMLSTPTLQKVKQKLEGT